MQTAPRAPRCSIEWKATNSMQILNALTRVRQLMNSRSLSLAEAVRYTPQNLRFALVTSALLLGGDCHCYLDDSD